MTNTENIETIHTHTIHIATAFPGGHSNTALCGTPLIGKIRPVRKPSTCSDCRKAAQ
jgi:hypothetical protein